MTKKKRQRREYLRFLDKSKESAECAIDNFNRAKGPFRTEATLMLLGVAWELLAKAILIQMKKPIKKTNSEDTISAEVAVSRLFSEKRLKSIILILFSRSFLCETRQFMMCCLIFQLKYSIILCTTHVSFIER